MQVVLDSYPVQAFETGMGQEYEADSCVVCLNEFKVGEQVRTLSCKHIFHKACIDNWLRNHTTCPLCNVQLATRQVGGASAASPRSRGRGNANAAPAQANAGAAANSTATQAGPATQPNNPSGESQA